MQLRALRRTPAALPCDDLKTLGVGGVPAQNKRLDDTFFANGRREFAKSSFAESAARLIRVWADPIDSNKVFGPARRVFAACGGDVSISAISADKPRPNPLRSCFACAISLPYDAVCSSFSTSSCAKAR